MDLEKKIKKKKKKKRKEKKKKKKQQQQPTTILNHTFKKCIKAIFIFYFVFCHNKERSFKPFMCLDLGQER